MYFIDVTINIKNSVECQYINVGQPNCVQYVSVHNKSNMQPITLMLIFC